MVEAFACALPAEDRAVSLLFSIKWALVMARHMQTMPREQSVCPLCLVCAIDLQKLSYILFALNITFINKNVRQNLVSSVALSCLTWDRKSVCLLNTMLMVSLLCIMLLLNQHG